MATLRETIAHHNKNLKKQRSRMLRQASTLKKLKNSFSTFKTNVDSIENVLQRTNLSEEARRALQYQIDQLKGSLNHYHSVYKSWKPNFSQESEIREFLQNEINKKWYISRKDVHRIFKNCDQTLVEKIYGEFERKLNLFANVAPHNNIIYSVSSSNQNLIVSGSDDCTMRVWRIDDNDGLTCIGKIVVRDSVNCVCFSSDGVRLGAALHNGTIEIYDMTNCSRIRSFLGVKQMEVWALIFSPDRKFVVSGSLDSKIRVWNTHNSDKTAELSGHETWVNDLDFDPTGKFLASGSGDFHIRIWDFKTFECVRAFQAHNNFVRSVRWTDRGKLITSGEDGIIIVWETENFTKVRTIKGHAKAILCIDVFKDYIISASSDRTVRLWDIDTGLQLECFYGHGGDVNTVMFLADGMFAVSGSDDSALKLWNLSNYVDTC